MIDDAKPRAPEPAGVHVLGIRHAGRRSLNRPALNPALRVPLAFSALKCCEAAWPTLVRPLPRVTTLSLFGSLLARPHLHGDRRTKDCCWEASEVIKSWALEYGFQFHMPTYPCWTGASYGLYNPRAGRRSSPDGFFVCSPLQVLINPFGRKNHVRHDLYRPT